MTKLKYDFITFISSANPEYLFWFRIKYIPYDCVINRFLNAALVLFHTFIRGKGSLKSIDI